MPHPTQGYRNKDGKKIPGVTTIINRFKDSGALLWWAFEQGKLAEQGEINNLYDKRDEAADAGTQAHEMVEKNIKGESFDEKDYCEEAIQGFHNYLEWQKNSKITVAYQEEQLVSEEYQFGGCPDAVGMDSQGRFCLLDWKTSNGIYLDYLIQLAAYKHLWNIYQVYNDHLITGGFHLLRFSKEHADFAHHYYSELDDAWEAFKLMRKLYDLDKILKRRV